MPQIVPAGSINLSALQDPDLYLQILQPPSFIRGVPTDVIGLVGTASWGPVNQPVSLGSGQEAALAFGPISAVSLLDPYDIATDLYLAFGQASSTAIIQGFGVRVTDGTDTAATVALAGAATAVPEVLTVGGTITAGDQIQITCTSSALSTSPTTTYYTVRTGDTITSIAAAIGAALNNNPVLNAAQVYATVNSAVVTAYWPAALSPTITWGKTITGAATETVSLSTGSTTTAGGTVAGLYTGVLGVQCKMVIAASPTLSNAYNVTVSGFSGTAEYYPGIPAVNFWRKLQSALASGLQNIRGPSSWLRLSTVNASVGVPTVGTYNLTGGSDGRGGVTTSTLLGSSTATPPTGLWALQGTNPQVGIAWVTGLTDTNAVATVDSFALTAGVSALFPFPTGTTTAQALTLTLSDGVGGPEFVYVKDSVYWLDTVNNLRRLSLPTAVIGGMWATQAVQNSPLNKPVQLVLGTERNDPVNGTTPYTPAEIGQLNTAGILVITNPVPGGAYFGIRTGASTSPNTATQPVEYWRLTMFLARSLSASLGQYVGQLQSQQPGDALRSSVKMSLNSFAETLARAGTIDSGIGYCEYSNNSTAKFGNGMNTPSSVAQHYLYALFKATYLSSVWFFVASVQGGTTVVTVTPGQA